MVNTGSDDATSLAFAIKAVMLSCVIDAMKGRDDPTVNIPVFVGGYGKSSTSGYLSKEDPIQIQTTCGIKKNSEIVSTCQ